jgi:hypothetical protein
MNKPSIIQTLSVAVAVGLGAIQAQAQSVTFDFAGGSNQGWTSGGFSAGAALPVSTISGNNYVFVPVGSFQAANVASGYAGNLAGFNAAMSAALINPSGYNLSYNWYVNTAGLTTNSTFLQLGTFLNAGSGYYQQDYSTPNQVSLNGTQLASGGILSGTVTINIGSVFPADANAATESFWRLGLIVNGNGAGNGAYFNDISITPVPEPTMIALAGLGGISMLFLRRRKA